MDNTEVVLIFNSLGMSAMSAAVNSPPLVLLSTTAELPEIFSTEADQ